MADIKAELAAAHQGVRDRFRAGDYEGIAAKCYTTSSQVLPPGAPAVDNKGVAKAFRDLAESGAVDLVSESQDIKHQGDLAVQYSTYKTIKADNSNLSSGCSIYTWLKEDGQWKIQYAIFN